MRCPFRALLFAGLLLPFAAAAAAQSTDQPAGPVAPTETQQPPETATPPVEPTAAAPPIPVESAPAQPIAAPKILILPPEFTVYQRGAATLEPVPNWTDDARRYLAESARRVLAADGRFAIVDTPPVGADHEAELREHIELFKVIGWQLNDVVKVGGSAWEETRRSADYRIGPGLMFLKQQSGADYAFVLAGSEVRQSKGSIYMQLLLAGAGISAPGGGTYMYAGILNLETGKLTWFGSQLGIQSLGFGGGPDARSSSGADAALSKILITYPRTAGLDLGSGMAN